MGYSYAVGQRTPAGSLPGDNLHDKIKCEILSGTPAECKMSAHNHVRKLCVSPENLTHAVVVQTTIKTIRIIVMLAE